MKHLNFVLRRGRALCLFWLMLLTAPLAVSAQETLTIYPDATGTSSYVPIPGGSVARFMKSEFVIPASQLEAVEGGTISQMAFHLSQTGSINGSLNFQVFLKEVNATTINSYYGPEGATIVYEGPLDGSQSTMDIAFTNNYTYHGGNLLVGVYQIAATYFVTTIQFLGQTVSGASVQGTGSSLEGVSCTQRNFIPKTTFTYTAGNNTCPVPKNLAISNVTNNSATLSWTQNGDVDHWDVFYTDNPNYEPKSYTHPQFANINTKPFTLTELDAGRMYYVYVRGNCGDEVGDWSGPCVFLAADQITLNDGTTTNQYVPLAGEYVANSNSYGAFILPATDLQAITNAEIRQLTFYTNSPDNISWGELTYSVQLRETEFTEFTTSTNFSVGQQCYYGRISVVGNKMTLTFDEPYVYGGGNLAITYTTFKPGTVTNGRAYWLGVTTQNTSGYGSSRYRYQGTYSTTEYTQRFLPKTTIFYVFPDCIKPTDLEVSSTTTTSATLSWTALGSGQTEWEIQYRKYDETDYTAVEGTVTNPYTIQGLEPSHNYVARVRAVCGSDSYSDWVETSFNTDCAPITLPYTYGFEDVEEYGFPACWSYLVSGSASNPLTWDAYWSHAGNRCLTMYCNDSEGSVTTILPEIPVDAEHPMSGNELVFYAVAYSGYAICQVGVMTDPTDPASFELVKELEVIEGLYSYGNYRKFKVSFANYTGSGTYIAIRKVRELSEYAERLLIDDIEVRPIPDYHEPADLTVTAVTSSTATLQWTAGGEETSWHVQYKLPNDEWPDTYQTVGQNLCTLEGLTLGTAYRVRVRAAYSATETSDWTNYAKFITHCITPYYEDFDTNSSSYSNDNPSYGWRFVYGNPIDDVLAGTAQLVPGYEASGWQIRRYDFTNPDNGMTYLNDYLAECYTDMSDYYIWMISPYIELGEGYQLNFDLGLEYTHTDPSGLDDNRFGVLITQDNGATWSLLALWDNDGTEGRFYYDLPEIPAEVDVAIPATFNNKLVRIAFCAESEIYNSGTNHLFLDNINITKCVKPDMIVASNITTNSASINWTSHGESSWTLQYRIGETGDWTTVNNITAHPYNLSSLVNLNYYQVRVKAHYAAGDSEWSTIAQFATECMPINLGPDDVYVQTFEFEGEADPPCWSADPFTVGNPANGGWAYSSYYDEQLNTKRCARAVCNWGTINANLVMPEIEVTPGLCITFHHSKIIKTSARIDAFITLPWLENVVLWSTETDDLSEGVTTLSLNDYVDQTVTFTFNFYAVGSGEFNLYDVTLRNMNTFTNQTEDGYWNETANWSKSVLPQEGQSVLVNGEAVIPNSCIAQANEILMTSNGTLTIADGGQLKHNNEGVKATAQKSIVPYTIMETNGEDKANGWYLIASPMAGAIEPAESMFANNIDLYRFNQSVELEWENYYQYFYLSPYFMLNNGQGYLYANAGDGESSAVTIELEGQLQPSAEDVEVPLVYDASADFAGFNLVGNPFACNAYLAEPRDFYVMNGTNDELEISTSANGVVAPLQGLFVQAANANDDAITFTTAMPQKQGEALTLNLSNGPSTGSGTLVLDRARVRFGEGPTLNKFSLKPNGTKLFIPQGHQDYAVVYAEKQGEVPVNFKAAENGSYTLSVNPENAEMSYLYLIDNLTGADVDLLTEPSYTFEAKTTDYASRFRLVFSANETDGSSTGSETFAFISNGNIVITGDVEGATLQVIDVMGRVLVSRDAAHHISTNGMTPGVYVLRLINGDDVKTQKIVVR